MKVAMLKTETAVFHVIGISPMVIRRIPKQTPPLTPPDWRTAIFHIVGLTPYVQNHYHPRGFLMD